MSGTFTINLAKPVTSVKTLDNYSLPPSWYRPQKETSGANTGLSWGSHFAKNREMGPPCRSEINPDIETQQSMLVQDLEKQKAQAAQLCQTLNNLVGKLNQFYDEALASHKEEIAKLSVEIARKILMQKVQKGDYQIESIVKEVLKNAPSRQDVVVHLNPGDLAQCQKLQQDDPGSAIADIKFVPDPKIGRAECLLETPKGIVKSFINEHMERIGEALEKVE